MKKSNEIIKWHRLIGILAVVWNLLGVYAYLMHAYMTDESIALLPENEQALYTDIPAWYTAAFAIAVFAGALGSVLLLIKRKMATPFLLLSLLAIFVQMYYNFFMSKALEVYGIGNAVMPIFIIIVGVYLVWYSRTLQNAGLLR
jgi:hypothetical protein